MSGVTKEGEKRDDGFLILFFLKTQNKDIICLSVSTTTALVSTTSSLLEKNKAPE